MATAPSKIVEKKDFPAGLGVLVVDDDLLCLKVVEKMLKACKYKGATDGARFDERCAPTMRRRDDGRRGDAKADAAANDAKDYVRSCVSARWTRERSREACEACDWESGPRRNSPWDPTLTSEGLTRLNGARDDERRDETNATTDESMTMPLNTQSPRVPPLRLLWRFCERERKSLTSC